MREQPTDERTKKAILRVIMYATQMAQYYEENDEHWLICHNLTKHYLNDIELDILEESE